MINISVLSCKITLAKASLLGAKTVYSPGFVNGSTKSAACSAASSVLKL